MPALLNRWCYLHNLETCRKNIRLHPTLFHQKKKRTGSELVLVESWFAVGSTCEPVQNLFVFPLILLD